MRRAIRSCFSALWRALRRAWEALTATFDRGDVQFFAGLSILYVGASELNVAYARVAIGAILMLVALAGDITASLAVVLGRKPK